MEIRVLRYFVSVAQTHNMSESARILHVSQPTLSRQIADLETELGGPLFERRSREMVLTPTGRYLFEKTTTILKLVDKTTANVQAQQVNVSGTLDIGAGESIQLKSLMNLLGHFQIDYPDVVVHLHTGNAMAIDTQLENGVLDIGVVMGRRDLHLFNALHLPGENQWGLLMPTNSPLLQKTAIAPNDLIGLPLLVSEQSLLREFFADWWRNVADEITVVGTYDLIYNAGLLMQERNCYAIGFDGLISGEASSKLAFRPLSPALSEPNNVIWSKNQQLSSAASLFIKRVQATFE